MKQAEKRLCVCDDKEKSNIVYTDTISGDENSELESYDGFYCINCNSFWREP